jgi:hypothetical protein
MAGKISFLAGVGVGYVLGTRSGRGRYEQIAGKARELWDDPRVQEKAEQAQQVVTDKAGEAASKAASMVSEKVGSGGAGSSGSHVSSGGTSS